MKDNGRLQERKLHRLNLFSCRECPFSRIFRSISAGDVYTRVESDRRGEIDKTSALDAQKSERSNLSSITDACHDDTKLKHKRDASDGYVLGKDFEECSVLGPLFALSAMFSVVPVMNMRSGRREPNVFSTLFPSVNLGSRDLRSMRETDNAHT